MKRKLIIRKEKWPIKGSFRISRGSINEITVVKVGITENESQGYGECRPYSRYNETPESVLRLIESVRTNIEKGAKNIELQSLLPAGAARNAIDCALWDLEAKIQNKSISELLKIPEAKPRKTAFTLSVDTPANIKKAAEKAISFSILKIKINGFSGLESCLAVLENRPDAKLIIDANESLNTKNIVEFLNALKNFPVAMIEQPLPDKDYNLIPKHLNKFPIICAHESFHTITDLNKLWDAGYRVVTIKPDKCGGLTAALKLIHTAKKKGFIIMNGCMVGTSLAMAPIMSLECFADYIDLDGPLLLLKDRKSSMNYEKGIIHPAKRELWG